jgi:hypothetical protein
VHTIHSCHRHPHLLTFHPEEFKTGRVARNGHSLPRSVSKEPLRKVGRGRRLAMQATKVKLHVACMNAVAVVVFDAKRSHP